MWSVYEGLTPLWFKNEWHTDSLKQDSWERRSWFRRRGLVTQFTSRSSGSVVDLETTWEHRVCKEIWLHVGQWHFNHDLMVFHSVFHIRIKTWMVHVKNIFPHSLHLYIPACFSGGAKLPVAFAQILVNSQPPAQ